MPTFAAGGNLKLWGATPSGTRPENPMKLLRSEGNFDGELVKSRGAEIEPMWCFCCAWDRVVPGGGVFVSP